MEQQTSLFNTSVKHPVKENDQVNETPDDRAFKELQKLGLDLKCQIFEGGDHCQGLIVNYLDGNDNIDADDILLDDVTVLEKRAAQTKPHHYYHYIDYHFIPYNAFILKQIIKSRKDIK